MPELAEIVSETIKVVHITPSAYRKPIKMVGMAPGKITFVNICHFVNRYDCPISINFGSID